MSIHTVGKLHISKMFNPKKSTSAMRKSNGCLRSLPFVLLANVGVISSKKNTIIYFTAFCLHIIILYTICKLTFCSFSRINMNGTLITILIADVITLMQWWSLFIKRDKIVELAHILNSTSRDKQRNLHSFFMKCSFIFIVILMIISFFESLINMIFYIQYRSKTKLPCIYTFIPLETNYLFVVIVFIEVCNMYLTSALIYIPTFLHVYFAYRILNSQPKLSLNRIEGKILQAHERCKNIISIIEKLEKAMSFSMFLVFLKIGLKTFVFITVFSEDSSSVNIGFYIHASKLLFLFIFVSFTADLLQKRCHETILLIFNYKDNLKLKGIKMNYFTYKDMIRKCTLTGWNMFIINRNLVFTYFSSLVTYGVIVYQMSQSNWD